MLAIFIYSLLIFNGVLVVLGFASLLCKSKLLKDVHNALNEKLDYESLAGKPTTLVVG